MVVSVLCGKLVVALSAP
ncbi:hypothetical protein MRO13_16205 [Vibrio metschnikovii]